jgi:hypothetical protein
MPAFEEGIGRLGKKTKRLGKDAMFEPAVFELVCEGSGRRLVGATDAPNLRKAVYFFHLKNITKYSNANPFFGCAAALEDLDEHGFDNFYFEIVKQLPLDMTPDDLEVERNKQMAKYSVDSLYNRVAKPTSRGTSYKQSRFTALEPEMAALETKREQLIAVLTKIEAEYKKARADAKVNVGVILTDPNIKSTAHGRHLRKNSAVWRAMKPALDAAKKELNATEKAIHALNEKFIKKYTEQSRTYRKARG